MKLNLKYFTFACCCALCIHAAQAEKQNADTLNKISDTTSAVEAAVTDSDATMTEDTTMAEGSLCDTAIVIGDVDTATVDTVCKKHYADTTFTSETAYILHSQSYGPNVVLQKDFQKPEWIDKLFRGILSVIYEFANVAKYLIIVVVLIVPFLIVRFQYKFKKKSPKDEVLGDDVDVQKEKNLRKIIEQLISQQKYATATGKLYEYTIKQIEEKGWIKTTDSKTPSEYYNEFKVTKARPIFHELIQIYLNIRYGNHLANLDDVKRVDALRLELMKTLPKHTKK